MTTYIETQDYSDGYRPLGDPPPSDLPPGDPTPGTTWNSGTFETFSTPKTKTLCMAVSAPSQHIANHLNVAMKGKDIVKVKVMDLDYRSNDILALIYYKED